MTYNIALHVGHNATVAISKDEKIVEVVELERVFGIKNCDFHYLKGDRDALIKAVMDVWVNTIGNVSADVLVMQTNEFKANGQSVVTSGAYRNIAKYNRRAVRSHHESHACGTFYQSPFKEALAISIDGGGNDGEFVIFHMRRHENPRKLARLPYNLGSCYSDIGSVCGSIKLERSLKDSNLIYPGKLMGLAGYGTVDAELLKEMKIFFKTRNRSYSYRRLYEKTGIRLFGPQRYTGDKETTIAATAQRAFEEVVIESITPYVNQFPDIPLCLTGGCALNIIANSKIEQHFGREVFVAPNSNDCGLAVGMLASIVRPAEPFDVTYAGVDILDRNTFPYQNYDFKPLDMDKIGSDLLKGKIFGIMRGRSEHGPRALGNRSIVCYPAYPEMKDILNKKIKNREWYRPFAPVVRLEDVGKYFERDKESRWMNFITYVRPEYREILPAITHADGTARVQTVTRDQNPFLYDLLTYIDKKTGIGVLLNTSLNVDGQPIASKIEHTMTVYDTTNIDGVIIEDQMVLKDE